MSFKLTVYAHSICNPYQSSMISTSVQPGTKIMSFLKQHASIFNSGQSSRRKGTIWEFLPQSIQLFQPYRLHSMTKESFIEDPEVLHGNPPPAKKRIFILPKVPQNYFLLNCICSKLLQQIVDKNRIEKYFPSKICRPDHPADTPVELFILYIRFLVSWM